MKTAAKIFPVPIWLLTIGGGLLLMYDLLLVILNMSSKELWIQLIAITGATFAIPFIAGLIEGLLERAADAIKEFIVS